MLKNLKYYSEYITESEELEAPLKGYTADQIIARIEEMMEILSDDVRFGVPSDNLGRALTYRDANGAIQRIKDLQHYYDSNDEQVRYYCWSIAYNGSWKATKNLKAKIEAAGGLGQQPNNISFKNLIDYFTQNPEDSDNVRSLSISIDAKKVRKSQSANQEKEEQPQEETAQETAKETQQDTQNQGQETEEQ
jgi:hypothetical protein